MANFEHQQVQQTRGHDKKKPDAVSYTNGLGNGEGVAGVAKLTASEGESGINNADKQIFQATWMNVPHAGTNNSMEPKGQQTSQLDSRVKAAKMREKATKEKEVALNKAQFSYNKFIDKLQIMLEKADNKENEEINIVDHEYMKATIIAAAISRNALQKWTNEQKNAENIYQETLSKINQKIAEAHQVRDATCHSADAQFVKTHAEAEENKRKAIIENKEVLMKGQTEYTNAVKSAQKIKTQAEIEYRNAASNDILPLEQWAKIAAKYEAETETYKRALQEADEKWQNVLNQVGIGSQYKETLNKAVIELVNAHRKAVSDARTAVEQYNEELRKIQNLKTDIERSANTGKQEAERELKEARNKAKNEAEKKKKIISQDRKRTLVSAKIYLKKFDAEFQKIQAEVYKRFDEAMKEASIVENGTEKPSIKTMETVPSIVADGEKKN